MESDLVSANTLWPKHTYTHNEREREFPDRHWHLIHNMPALMAPKPLTPDQSNHRPHRGCRAMRTACLPSGYPIRLVEGGQSVIMAMCVLHRSSRAWSMVRTNPSNTVYTQVGLHFKKLITIHGTMSWHGGELVFLSKIPEHQQGFEHLAQVTKLS